MEKQVNNKLIVAYVRLSQEDLDKQNNFSESIYNQIDLIKSHAKIMGLKIDKEYIDDGYSGTNFNRPGFENLINDIEKGTVGLIITKDMSRLGRNFLETAYYISEYFPKKEVRYVAINDGYDSASLDDKDQEIVMQFKSLINDRYVKDIYIKRKQIAELKTNEGQFIGFIAPYGYKVLKKNKKRTLEIDDYAASIVKRIFTEITSGKNRREVADGLNKDRILPPVIYMNMTPSRNKKYYYDWSDKIVYRILKNQTYTGKIVKRKSIKNNYLQEKREFIPIKDRETISNCHQAIITEQLFKEANDKLIVMKRKQKKDYNGVFDGLVICGECGRVMTACRRSDRLNVKYRFECTKVIDRKPCPNRTIAESKLNSIIFSILQEIIGDYVSEDEIVKQVTKNMIRAERPNLKIAHLKDDIKLHNKNIRNLYLKKTKGEITLEQFLETKKNETLLKEKSEKLLKKILESKNEDIRKKEILKQYRYFMNDDDFINSTLQCLIDKIVIYRDSTIKILFKFRLDELKKVKLF